MRVCNLGCLVITLVWQSHVKPSLCWSPTAQLPALLPAFSCFPHLAPLTLFFPPLSLPPACYGFKKEKKKKLQSGHQTSVKKFYQLYTPLTALFIWQAWNMEENVNMCFLVAGQVYEIHLYQRMHCQGVDGRCVWSRGWFISSRKKAYYSEVWMCWCVHLKEEGTESASEGERERQRTGVYVFISDGIRDPPRLRNALPY